MDSIKEIDSLTKILADKVDTLKEIFKKFKLKSASEKLPARKNKELVELKSEVFSSYPENIDPELLKWVETLITMDYPDKIGSELRLNKKIRDNVFDLSVGDTRFIIGYKEKLMAFYDGDIYGKMILYTEGCQRHAYSNHHTACIYSCMIGIISDYVK